MEIINITTSDFDESAFPIPPKRIERSAKQCIHTPVPDGYLAWNEWARCASNTHLQVRCPCCGKWAIWLPKEEARRIRKEDERQERLIIQSYQGIFVAKNRGE